MNTRPSKDLADECRAMASGGTSSDVIYDLVLRNLGPISATAMILDFGCGQGRFLQKLAKIHPVGRICGVDILDAPLGIPPGVTYAKQNLNSHIAYANESFDVVFALEVIEHIENPRFMVRDIDRILKPGGRLVITTPNNENIRGFVSLIVRGHYWAFCGHSYPAHITALLELDMTRIAAETGLAVNRVAFSNSGGVVGCPSIKWQQSLGKFARGRYFSDNILFDLRKAI